MTTTYPNETTTLGDLITWVSGTTDSLFWPVMTFTIASIVTVIMYKKSGYTEFADSISGGVITAFIMTLIGMGLGGLTGISIMSGYWLLFEIFLFVLVILYKRLG